jgi:electron transfer flavoprotein alpha subunit
MTKALVLLDHDRGALAETALQAVAFALSLEVDVEGVVIGDGADSVADELGGLGISTVHVIGHEILTDYAPEAFGDSLAQLVVVSGAKIVTTTGTDRGNEVMAHLAAILDQPMVANVMSAEPGTPWKLVRIRWGGSLFEHVELDAPFQLTTVAPHSWEAPEADAGTAPRIDRFEPTLDDDAVRTRVVDRVTLHAGITLATAPVVVGGGRGVGSAEGFASLEELAGILGGVVGCSRVVTNNGWRPHTDQVGQTGTRIAPDLYIACGVSGAIQHWVGAMASKKILAINTDPEANMMTKADYAVVGDLHEVLPALIEALK